MNTDQSDAFMALALFFLLLPLAAAPLLIFFPFSPSVIFVVGAVTLTLAVMCWVRAQGAR